MIAKFSVNGSDVYHNNIVDIDISMYDEIMVSSMSSPEFSVTFACNFLDKNIENSFAYWWSEIKHLKPEITLIDSSGNSLASGLVFDYEELYEEFKLRLTAKSFVGVILDANYAVYPNLVYPWLSVICQPDNFEGSFGSFMFNLIDAYNTLFGVNPYDSNSANEISLTFNYNFVKERFRKYYDFARSKYNHPIIRFYSSWSGRGYDFLRQLSKFLGVKITYSNTGIKSFVLDMLGNCSEPVGVQGYLKSSSTQIYEKEVYDLSLFDRVFASSFGDSNLENRIDITSNIKEISTSFDQNIDEYTLYEIFGFASRIINTGETISLDGVMYYVKEISYDMERLNDVKSFNCVGVRFS